jgi:hypothetical protein
MAKSPTENDAIKVVYPDQLQPLSSSLHQERIAMLAGFRTVLSTIAILLMLNTLYGGGRGIRTPGTVSRTSVFKTDCFNRSHIPPRLNRVYQALACLARSHRPARLVKPHSSCASSHRCSSLLHHHNVKTVEAFRNTASGINSSHRLVMIKVIIKLAQKEKISHEGFSQESR